MVTEIQGQLELEDNCMVLFGLSWNGGVTDGPGGSGNDNLKQKCFRAPVQMVLF